MYHRPRDLDRYRPSTVPNCTCRARRGHDRNEHRRLRGRKDQTASPRRFAPPKQMLRCDVVPSRNFRHDYARLIGFRDYLALDLIAPPAPTANPGANINAAASLRSVNYMVNHICEPIQSRRATSSGSDRTLQDGDRAPLTVGQRTAVINQIRSFLLERSIAVRQGPRFRRQQLPEILAKRIDVLSPRMIGIIEDLSGDWRRLDERIERVTEEIQQLAHGSESCRRLMTVPGVGETAS